MAIKQSWQAYQRNSPYMEAGRDVSGNSDTLIAPERGRQFMGSIYEK